MKILFSLLVLVLSHSVHASFYQNNCSNADTTALWKEGHVDNEATFTVINDSGEMITKTFSAGEVTVKFTKKRTLLKKTESGRCWVAYDHYYSAFATVTPSAEIRTEFLKLFKNGKMSGYVICHDQLSGETDCDE